MLPKLAQGDANKVFVIPSEFAEAFGGLGKALARRAVQDGEGAARARPNGAGAGPAGRREPAAAVRRDRRPPDRRVDAAGRRAGR